MHHAEPGPAAAAVAADAGAAQPRRLVRLVVGVHLSASLLRAAAAADAAAQREVVLGQSGSVDQPRAAVATSQAAAAAAPAQLQHREHFAAGLWPGAVFTAAVAGGSGGPAHRRRRRSARRRRPASRGPAEGEAETTAAAGCRPGSAGQPAAAGRGQDGVACVGVLYSVQRPALLR